MRFVVRIAFSENDDRRNGYVVDDFDVGGEAAIAHTASIRGGNGMMDGAGDCSVAGAEV